MSDELRGKLVHQVARLGAARQEIQQSRKAIIQRAQEQLDSMADAIHAAEASVQADTAGILGQRRLRTLLTERSRLEHVIGDYHSRTRAAEDGRTPQDAP